MAAAESAYSSLLQGVSQQLAKLRLPGQVSAQENMLSDTTTGPRRRPGAEYKFSMNMVGEDDDSIRAWSTDISSYKVHVIVGTNTGRWVVLNHELDTVLGTGVEDYLKAARPVMIRATTVGSDFYIGNTSVLPTTKPEATALTPEKRGFCFIKTGAYGKSFRVTITTDLGTRDQAMTTPDGTTAGDYTRATPEYIATQLMSSVSLAPIGVQAFRVGAYIYYECTTAARVSITTGSGVLYLQASGYSKVRLVGDLPAILPEQANGYIVAVGEQRSFQYYQYASATTEWLEAGQFGSVSALTNMPVRLKVEGGVWSVEKPDYEGRVSGDDDNNPMPEFLKRGITGMSSYMNRLVLLSGSKVCMSSSTNALRFMRSTVTTIVETDPIEVGSSANSSAEYRYAVQFQKDLLLFSDKYQALIPSNGQAITPRNATVVITSSYAGDMGTEPIGIGRTLLFPAPKSRDFFGLMEMISSQYSEAQYVSNDATAHLPKYMGGTCRFGVSSTTSNTVVFGSSGDRTALIVYEYLWDGEEKVQQAWHTWRFKYPIATAYFSQGVVGILFIRNGLLVSCNVDPRQGTMSSNATRRPYIDMYTEVEVVDGIGTVPEWMRTFDPDMDHVLTVATGPMAGEERGVRSYDPATGQFEIVRGFGTGRVCIGVRFKSSFSPTPPTFVDRNGVKVESAKFTVLKFGITTQHSGEYRVMVTDDLSENPFDIAQATLYYSSNELVPGRGMVANASRATVPCRTNADSTTMLLFTDGTRELNITGIDYIGRLNLKIRRM